MKLITTPKLYGPSVPPGYYGDDTAPNIFEIIETYKFVMNDTLLDPFINATNIGIPLYKQAKGLIPFGAIGEGGVSFLLQVGSDLFLPDLNFGQRVTRAGIVGLESAFTDAVSTGAGSVAGVAVGIVMIGDFVPLDEIPGSGVAFFVGMAATNAWITQAFDNQNKIWFSKLNTS